MYYINTLHSLHQKIMLPEWKIVEIVESDIRSWNPIDYKADLIVSELLGSFGDNELSPECLDSARLGGVFIPSSYTSYISPVSAPNLFAPLRLHQNWSKNDLLQCPHVVHLHTSMAFSMPKICFQFDHSLDYNPLLHTNQRFKNIKFMTHSKGIVHGFAGYFSCTLYKDIILSINPVSYSTGMFSWFPFFFPLKNPILTSMEQEISLSIWRKVSTSSVWYEWCIESPSISMIHNSGGKHYQMALH
ncbi:hypothetical protein HZS_917 [Henneguya salminicola]|nr:hypothetical protein HZS_917 [Henneguya salminicola]